MVNEKLLQIERYLKNINAPVLNYLSPGVEIHKLEMLLKHFLNISQVSDEIASLYKWHDGTNINYEIPGGNFYLFPTYYLNSLENIKSIYESNNFQIVENKMFPIFSSGQGEHLIIDLKSNEKSRVFCIQPWNPEADTYTAIYDDLSTMLDTIINCYKKKIYYVSENLLEMDFEKAWEISAKMNPYSKFWQS